MTESIQPTNVAKDLKPALIADRVFIQGYYAHLRRIVVGMTGSAQSLLMVCPHDPVLRSILCPTAEHINHPAINLPFVGLQNRRILLDKLERFKPTLLHGFYPGDVKLLDFLSVQLDLPHVLSFMARPSKSISRYLSDKYTLALNACSEPIFEDLLTMFPLFSERIRLIPPGSYVEDTQACYADANRNLSLLMVQPLKKVSDFDPLLRALRHLIVDGFEFVFAIVGAGPAERAIRKQIRTLELTHVVTIVPMVRPIRSVLGGADYYIHFRQKGLFSHHVLEAMSLGLVVAGEQDPVTNLMVDSQTAVCFDRHNELNIYRTLKKLLETPTAAKQLALNAQRHIEQHNSVSAMVEKLLKSYHF